MPQPTLVVPRGAEAAAVRRARPRAPVVVIRAGAAARDLPAFAPGTAAIVVGLCGALRDRRVGDVVFYRRVRDAHGTYACEPPGATLAAHPVDACTTDHVVTTRAERRALAERYDADVVDMEGTHLAAALAARGIPCTMLRVVSDDAARDLPALDGAIRADGHMDVARIALAFARDPRGAYAFVRDVRRALRVLTATVATA